MKLSSEIISVFDSERHVKQCKVGCNKGSSINLVNVEDFTHRTLTNFDSTVFRLPVIKKKISIKYNMLKSSHKNSRATLVMSSDNLDTNLPFNNNQSDPAYCFPKRESLAPIFLYKKAKKHLFNSIKAPITSAHTRNFQDKYFHHLLITSLNSPNTSIHLNT